METGIGGRRPAAGTGTGPAATCPSVGAGGGCARRPARHARPAQAPIRAEPGNRRTRSAPPQGAGRRRPPAGTDATAGRPAIARRPGDSRYTLVARG